jgi:hypothetical protein
MWVGGRQARRVGTQDRAQGFGQIPGGKAAQIQRRNERVQTGGPAQVRRKPLANELLAGTLVVDPRLMKVHRPGRRGQGSLRQPPITHHQATSLLVSLIGVSFQILRHLVFNRLLSSRCAP